MNFASRFARAAGTLALPALVGLQAGCASTPVASAPAPTPAAPATLPLKHTPQPTGPDITTADLMTRLYIIADDSMMGREAGTIGNFKATNYIAAQAQAIGLEPAGENGTYFQAIPLVSRAVNAASTLSVGGTQLVLGTDFVLVPPLSGFLPYGRSFVGTGVQTVYGGRIGGSDMITPAQAAGKLVVFSPPLDAEGQPTFQFWGAEPLSQYAGAAGLAIASLDISPPQFVAGFLQRPNEVLADPSQEGPPAPLAMLLSDAAVTRLLGAAPATLKPGALGKKVDANMGFSDSPTAAPARNVIGLLRGSDPALRGEYVAVGAHNDHVGMSPRALEHDSLRAYNTVMRPGGAEDRPGTPNAVQAARIQTIRDSLRALYPERRDSVFNGADDDGSGTATVLEVAQALAAGPRPKRSVLFVWHTAEEKGLYGSEYFTDHPTVPRDSIVAQINIDMVGRGAATDETGKTKDGTAIFGGPDYLQVIGSRRLSTELGDLAESVNAAGQKLKFDYALDANGHPMNIYCRSDHYSYARYGIPIVFFTTGGHRDYHMLTDEAQYIDYTKMMRVGKLVRDLTLTVANLDHRVVVDQPKPDPKGNCQQ